MTQHIDTPAPSHANGTGDLRLLRYFSTASLAAFIVVAVLMGYVFKTLSVDNLVNGYQSEHVNHARIIANETWDDYFGPLLVATENQSNAALAANPRIAELHRLILKLLEGTKIFKIKVYDLRGRTIYSTDLSQIGQDKGNNAGVIAALQGRNSSALVHDNQISTFEEERTNRDMVESYIPRFDPATGKVSGVFEIYRDATSMVQEISQRQYVLVGAVVGLLAVLYLIVFSVVKRAQERARVQSALAEAEERWKFALEGAGDGVWDRNLATGEVVFSNRYKAMYGFSDAEQHDRQEAWDARVHPDDLPQVIAEREAYFRGSTSSYESERRMQCKDGSWMWVLSRGMVVSRDAQGRPLRFTTITGYSLADAIGKTPSLLASGTHDQAFYQAMWQQIDTLGGWHGEIRNRRKSGQLYVEWLSIKRVCNAKGQVTHYVAVFSDISERKASEERMHHLAHYDVLTELPNRALFADRLKQAVAAAQRDNRRLALMFIDLDKFKPVNDELGHPVGDQLLRAVADRLRHSVKRGSDTVARVGGDEFVVLLHDVEAEQDAMTVALKIRATLEQAFVLDAHTVSISCSIGVALFPQHGATESVLLKNADTAMYHAKDAGRNSVHIFHEAMNALI